MAATGTFPSSDHFPLGRAFGIIGDVKQEPPSSARPFGLHVAAEPQTGILLDPDDITYDQARQIGLIRDGSELVPFSKHSTGTTNSVTAGGDGSSKTTATDSDTDATED